MHRGRGLLVGAVGVVERAVVVVHEQADVLDADLFESMAQSLAPLARLVRGTLCLRLGVSILICFNLCEPPLDAVAAPAPEPVELVLDPLALALRGAAHRERLPHSQ